MDKKSGYKEGSKKENAADRAATRKPPPFKKK
jgi:hypothetical protein